MPLGESWPPKNNNNNPNLLCESALVEFSEYEQDLRHIFRFLVIFCVGFTHMHPEICLGDDFLPYPSF